MLKKPSNLPYVLTATAVLATVLAAWLVRDHPTFQPVGPGTTAPEFTARALDGTPMSLEDYSGHVILLNIWATWCPPCIYELPSMQRLYEEFKGENFEIVAVSVDARLGMQDEDGYPGGDVRAFSDSLSLTFPILHDPDGRIRRTYRTTGLPESFLIGADGVIYRKVTGATEWDRPEYIDFIRRLIDQGE